MPTLLYLTQHKDAKHLEAEIQGVKHEMQDMKEEVQGVKEDIHVMKAQLKQFGTTALACSKDYIMSKQKLLNRGLVRLPYVYYCTYIFSLILANFEKQHRYVQKAINCKGCCRLRTAVCLLSYIFLLSLTNFEKDYSWKWKLKHHSNRNEGKLYVELSRQ